jgi:hypothetical protein
MNLELRQASFSTAFRTAREARADYFIVISVSENERDISVKGELFVARTGAVAATFNSYRTGQDRLRNASRNILDQLQTVLPFRAELIRRNQGDGLIDKGRADGERDGMVFNLVRRGSVEIQNEGIGLVYDASDIVGTLTIERADEEVSAGRLARVGFFDRITLGDEVFLVREESSSSSSVTVTPIDPELRNLLRTLR